MILKRILGSIDSSPELEDSLKEKIERLKRAIATLENNFSQHPSSFIDKNYKIKYAYELNIQQLEAAKTINGKVLIIAGAGTGKTRTLIYRTSFLLENRINAEKILIMTFTRRAAEEIKRRVNVLLGSNVSKNITSGTFHAFCNMILAKYSKILKISPQFTILDQGDSEDLLDLLKKQTSIVKQDDIPFPKKRTVQNIISFSRNRRIPVNELLKQNYPHLLCYLSDILVLEKQYDLYKRDNNLYDYDDLIDEVIKHLKSNKLFKQSLQGKFKYIMVDEYQDTNLPQKELIDLLSEREDSSLMVVGDDNQSIYSFRGANYENILVFGETYKNAKLIKLEQNYRSTPHILSFINNISDHISLGYKKSLFSTQTSPPSSKPEFVQCFDEEQEAEFIADKIIESRSRLDYKDISVLCRASFHSNFVQAEFLKRNIPFKVVGGIRFIERRHVKDILAYMKILWNPLDTISWHRILTLLDKIGTVTANKIVKDIQRKNGELIPLKDKKYLKRNKKIEFLYNVLISARKKSSLVEAFDIIKEYYISVLRRIEEDWEKRVEDFKVLERLCGYHNDIEKFLSNLALDPPNDSISIFVAPPKGEDDCVTISTIHSAKGLEWNTVFVISLIDGAIPHYKSLDDYEQLEEERKLFYVACSRAKEKLYLTAPSYLTTYQSYFDEVSRFIKEVDVNNYVSTESECV